MYILRNFMYIFWFPDFHMYIFVHIYVEKITLAHSHTFDSRFQDRNCDRSQKKLRSIASKIAIDCDFLRLESKKLRSQKKCDRSQFFLRSISKLRSIAIATIAKKNAISQRYGSTVEVRKKRN